MIVRSDRLDLVPLSPELVAALVDADLVQAAALAPFPLDATTFQGDAYVLSLRHAQLQADPGQAGWLLRAMVLRAAGRVAGRIGFHCPPDSDGTVEIGYSVAPGDRRRGYAGEAVRRMLEWAAEQGARRCLASVSPGNAPSQALLAGFGFQKIGERMDEIDGLEEVLALPLPLSR